MPLPINNQQKHQILRIAFPDLYEIATRKGSIWMSLWSCGNPVKGLEPLEVMLQLAEEDEDVIIKSGPFKWKLNRDFSPLHPPSAGVALSPDTDPVYFTAFRSIAGTSYLLKGHWLAVLSGLKITVG